MSEKPWLRIDAELERFWEDMNIYQVINPVNRENQEKKFRESFLESPENLNSGMEVVSIDDIGIDEPEERANAVSDPEFEYETLDFSERRKKFREMRNNLNDYGVPEEVKGIYEDALDEAIARTEIVENLGDPGTVRDASRRIYGSPSEEIVEQARDVLEEEEPRSYVDRPYTTSDMVGVMEETFDEVDLDWDVVVQPDSSVIHVDAANGAVSVPEERRFSENEIRRLPLHEIGVHAFREMNARNQKFGASRAAKYHLSEEGLTYFFESEYDLDVPELKKKYAGRVLAVNSVMEDRDFTETYVEQRQYFDHEQAWKNSWRAHRGGGFIKDHIYFEGRGKVEEFLEEYELEGLMKARIGFEQAEDLADSEVLEEPEYTPDMVADNMDSILSRAGV